MEQLRIEVIDRTYAAILAAKTPAERIAMANSAHRTARIMVESRVRQLYPDLTNEQRHREYLRRLLGDGAARYLRHALERMKVPYMLWGRLPASPTAIRHETSTSLPRLR